MTYQKKIPNTLDCGAVLTKAVLHGKWKSTLLSLIAEGRRRPSELQRIIPGATRRVLNVQLAELEQHGLVHKIVFGQLPLKVEYHLTSLGQSILPVIAVMEQWGNAHRAELTQALAAASTRAAT
ncbi:helix-turn-helix transcriptional regulator [Hymenobacter sp. BT507]|uniref:Helix-turn-helix transcriptional regulator n=1 Tax=Hymenobacter citatus TaxID=2763506 RepID=A0ABR7MMU7_9BACT|nr:helix-turn-helix domain-containing protein [Hymenobacter citatus]MBC6612386.1 helix-turn-helix transcriptional regulator [Hymenobacter citatus]